MNFKSVGKRIQKNRVSKGLSQAELAVKAEISAYHMGSIETGVRGPSIQALIKIASALDVTTDRLLIGHRPGKQSPYEREMAKLLETCSEFDRRVLMQILCAVSEILHEKHSFGGDDQYSGDGS